MREQLTYDDMGNINNLKRDGHATGINYNYTGNRLTSLSGALTGSYTYDANGNATKDRTGMNFRYNHLNLPDSVWNIGGTVKIGYLYDALGTKLRKIAAAGGTTTWRDYVGGIEYKKIGNAAREIEMIHTEEGYLQRNAGNNTYTYHYNLKDHLGNVRATLQQATGEIIQKHDYYPFGKAKALVTSGINKYLYNGKEQQDELGGQYDYGARFYDAEIGRWNVVDPLAEHPKQVLTSQYAYAANNPIRYIDPTGMIWEDPKQAERLNKSINNRIENVEKNSAKIQAQIDKGGLSDKKLAKLENRLAENSQNVALLNQSLADVEAIGNAAETYRLTGPSASDGTHGVVQGS